MKLIFHFQNGKVETFNVKKDSVSIGRDEMCDVVLPYSGFSRKHAEVELINDEIYVTDLGSTNGVFIDGERIPPNERKVTPSYLTLQIGPTTQVEILSDEVFEDIPVMTPKKEVTRSHPKLDIQLSSDVTRSTRLDSSFLKDAAKKKKEVKKKVSKTNNGIVIFLIFVLVSAAYFYFMQEDEPIVDADLIEMAPPAQPPITQTDFLSRPVIDSSYKNASCEGPMAQWCESGRLLALNKEGAFVEGKTLLVYLSMDSFINETYGEAFNQLDVSKRLEILALKRVMTSNLVSTFLRQNTQDTLQVVVGTIKEDQYSPFMVFRFKRDLAPSKLEKFTILGLFDQALNEGKFDALIDISLLYDKNSL